MAYEPKPMGNRLGIHAEKVEQRRRELGLDERGYPTPCQSETDPTSEAGSDRSNHP